MSTPNADKLKLERIARMIRVFNLVCMSEETTDSGEVWILLNDIARICDPAARPLADMMLPDLDAQVHDLLSLQATNINNEGARGQLEYLSGALNDYEWHSLLGMNEPGES